MASPTEIATVIDNNGISEGNACRLAQVSYADARSEQKRWQILAFSMGCTAAIALVAALVLYAVDEGTRAAALVAGLGTLVSGAAWLLIFKQRNDASSEKEKALALVNKYCEQPEKTVKELDQGATPAELVVPMAQA
ncbi:MAG TPA: hypothetical protein VFS48_03215 [Solirubrobacterales bacterium]|nr:hypothetical protein [Solirubrobacterales bacterium]